MANNDVIKLSEGFKLVPEGENIPLVIKKAEGKPKAKPQVIECTFEHKSGATVNNKFDLKNDGAMRAFSVLARIILGADAETLSVSKDLPKFVGKTIACTVEHSDYNGNTYANIRKMSKYEDIEEAVEDDDDEL